MGRLLSSFVEDHTSLCYFISFGVVGVLVDLDHLFYLFIPTVNGRAWHPALLVVCWLCLCSISAFSAGLLIKLVLKRLISFKEDRLGE